MFATTSHPSPKGSPHGQSPPPYYTLHQLHAMATRKCVRILPYVLGIIKHHLSCDVVDTSGMFKWDAGLVRDGCFFAGFLSASSESNTLADPDDRQQFGSMKQESDARIDGSLPPLLARSSYLPIYDAEDGVRICLTALSTMRWAFSKSEERRETLRMVWEDGKMRKRTIQSFSHPHTPHAAEAPSSALREIDLRYAEEAAAQPNSSSYVDMYGGGKVPRLHSPPTTAQPEQYFRITPCFGGLSSDDWLQYRWLRGRQFVAIVHATRDGYLDVRDKRDGKCSPVPRLLELGVRPECGDQERRYAIPQRFGRS